MTAFPQRLAAAGEDHEARSGLLRELYGKLMTMPQEKVDSLLNRLLSRLQGKPLSDKDSADFWAVRAAENFLYPAGIAIAGSSAFICSTWYICGRGKAPFNLPVFLHAYL